MNGLDNGSLRVAEPIGNHEWKVNQWLKKSVLLSFRLNDMGLISGAPETPGLGKSSWWDKYHLNLQVIMKRIIGMQALDLFLDV